jgi:hypothetical protein
MSRKNRSGRQRIIRETKPESGNSGSQDSQRRDESRKSK